KQPPHPAPVRARSPRATARARAPRNALGYHRRSRLPRPRATPLNDGNYLNVAFPTEAHSDNSHHLDWSGDAAQRGESAVHSTQTRTPNVSEQREGTSQDAPQALVPRTASPIW